MAIATLKRRAEFLRIRGGRRWSTPAFVIEMRARSDGERPTRAEMGAQEIRQDQEIVEPRAPQASGPARFGFTVTKKLGNAVARNRIRRRLREAVRLVAPGRASEGCDYVLIGREAAATRPFSALERDLSAAFAALHAPAKASQRSQGARTRNVSTSGRA